MQRLKDRRPSVVDPMIAAAREQGEVWALSPSAWTVDEIVGPDTSDQATVVSLAEMAAAAYVQDPNTRGWVNISYGFRNSTDFGW
jgi:lipase ATG15